VPNPDAAEALSSPSSINGLVRYFRKKAVSGSR
jgi:hypothetical protein